MLGGLEHKLKSMELMGPTKRLKYTVVWEATIKPCEEVRVKSIHKPLADADWVCPLA